MKNYPSSTCVLGSKRRLHQAPSHLARSTFIATLALTVASVALAKEAVDGPMRVIMEEELASKVGEGGEGAVWLSVLGEVYDVTAGRDYYGQGAGYSVFAGKDASAPFSTGDFSKEGAKQDLDDLSAKQLSGVEGWRTFYAEHETYEQIGVLCCEFYDADGKPTEKLINTKQRIAAHASMKEDEKKKKEL
mmetsp:Transcript_5371/g.11729  ORF Transcript_5371/g.11729 Transcript_5371/m.11729 type:complete len:190 (-) Transcript_5371:226-795(-)